MLRWPCLFALLVGALCAAALPSDPIAWENSIPLTSSSASDDALFYFNILNQTVARVSPANGTVVWYSAAINAFVFATDSNLVATENLVALAADVGDARGNMFWVFDAHNGNVLTNRSVDFNCVGSLVPVCGTYFFCVDGSNPLTTHLINVRGDILWSGSDADLNVLQPENMFCATGGTLGVDVVYFTAVSSIEDYPALVLFDTSTNVTTIMANVTTITSTLNGVAYALLYDGSVGALVLAGNNPASYLAWQWVATATSAAVSTFTNTANLYVVGTIVVVFGCSMTECVFVGVGVSDGSFVGQYVLTGSVQQPQQSSLNPVSPRPLRRNAAAVPRGLSSIAIVGPFLVFAYANASATNVNRLAMLNPVTMKIDSTTDAVPGNAFTVVPGNASCATSLFVPNGQGYSRVNSLTFTPISNNLELPGIQSQAPFPNVPSQGETTIVVMFNSGYNAAIVFTCEP